jgi:methionyl-tRNA synthetase
MLKAIGFDPALNLFAHGWWTINGHKMSKSVGNAVEPNLLVDQFGVDAIRYFLLREVPFGLDGDFSHKALIGRINSDLANNLGNLLNRTMSMIKRYHDQIILFFIFMTYHQSSIGQIFWTIFIFQIFVQLQGFGVFFTLVQFIGFDKQTVQILSRTQ